MWPHLLIDREIRVLLASSMHSNAQQCKAMHWQWNNIDCMLLCWLIGLRGECEEERVGWSNGIGGRGGGCVMSNVIGDMKHHYWFLFCSRNFTNFQKSNMKSLMILSFNINVSGSVSLHTYSNALFLSTACRDGQSSLHCTWVYTS